MTDDGGAFSPHIIVFSLANPAFNFMKASCIQTTYNSVFPQKKGKKARPFFTFATGGGLKDMLLSSCSTIPTVLFSILTKSIVLLDRGETIHGYKRGIC